MKKISRSLYGVITGASLALLCTGCIATNITKLVKEMGKDPATVQLSVTTVYGNLKLVRVGGMETNCVKTVSPDGTVTIKSGQ